MKRSKRDIDLDKPYSWNRVTEQILKETIIKLEEKRKAKHAREIERIGNFQREEYLREQNPNLQNQVPLHDYFIYDGVRYQIPNLPP